MITPVCNRSLQLRPRLVKPRISGGRRPTQGHVAQVDQVRRKLQYDFYYINISRPGWTC